MTEKVENNFIFTSFTLFPSSAFNVLWCYAWLLDADGVIVGSLQLWLL